MLYLAIVISYDLISKSSTYDTKTVHILLNSVTVEAAQRDHFGDSNNQMILISRSASTSIINERVFWDLSSWVNLIPFTN
jgi:hypothetical protein